MRVFIMTDMEGVAGVINSHWYCLPDSQSYEVGRGLTTGETKAAIEGVLGVTDAEFLVVDDHGGGRQPGAPTSRSAAALAPAAARSVPGRPGA